MEQEEENAESGGVTKSERFLGEVCRKTFLSIWSHQNLYIDRGIGENGGHGKELCDLLVIFDNHIIIFSDKYCVFPDSGDISVDWKRWYKRAVLKSADQIYGAERWLRRFPNRIFIDRDCTSPFPYKIPTGDDVRIHRVAIALGAGKRLTEHFGSNRSSSLIVTTIVEAERRKAADPFVIPTEDFRRGFVHVLDDQSMEVVLSELDTVADFVQFLERKEDFLLSSNYITSSGEEELLGFYLESISDEGCFPSATVREAIARGGEQIVIAEGLWNEYRSGDYAAFLAMSRETSKFYDGLIELFAEHLEAGTLEFGAEDSYSLHERNLRFLASEPRSHRAMITELIRQKLESTPRNVRTSIVVPSSLPNRIFILVLFPRSAGMSQRLYRSERQAALDAYAMVARMKNPEANLVGCLGVEPGLGRSHRSEDFATYDFSDWSDEDGVRARELQDELEILVDVDERRVFDRPNTRRGDLGGGNRRMRRRQQALERRK